MQNTPAEKQVISTEPDPEYHLPSRISIKEALQAGKKAEQPVSRPTASSGAMADPVNAEQIPVTQESLVDCWNNFVRMRDEKVEGFFEVCKQIGLTGEQGVMVPESNVRHLMLKDEVVRAAREGRFHIWAVKDADAGIEILTGTRAGEKQPDGTYPEGTVNQMVDQRLIKLAREAKEFMEPPAGGELPKAA